MFYFLLGMVLVASINSILFYDTFAKIFCMTAALITVQVIVNEQIPKHLTY